MSEFSTGNYVVFGGTSGVGLAVANFLLQEGARVLVPCRDFGKWTRLRGDAQSRGSLWGSATGPFTNEGADFPLVLEVLKSQAPLDGVLFASAAPTFAPLAATAMGALEGALDEVTAASNILRAMTTKGVMKKESSVVFMSSAAAVQGVPGLSAYSAAKAAIEALARTAAVEFAPRGIRVNCVRAAAFESPLHDKMTKGMPDASVKAYRDAHPLGFGQVADIKEAVLFLLSQSSRWITGTSMVVDGGYSAKAR